MSVYFELACITCNTYINLGNYCSMGFSYGNTQLYAFLDQHIHSTCKLLVCRDDHDSAWYDIKYNQNNLDQDYEDQINTSLQNHFLKIPKNSGIRIYNQLSHFIEIYQNQLDDLEKIAEFIINTSCLKNKELKIENVNCLPILNAQFIPLDRYEDSFDLGCIECKKFIDIGTTATWMVNGFEDYDLLYTFLAEHKNCSSKVYISTNYSSNKLWNRAENHLPNQFHCHPEWTWDTRSLNPKAICCYQSSISQFSDTVPQVLTLKSDMMELITISKDSIEKLETISDWLYNHKDHYIEIS